MNKASVYRVSTAQEEEKTQGNKLTTVWSSESNSGDQVTLQNNNNGKSLMEGVTTGSVMNMVSGAVKPIPTCAFGSLDAMAVHTCGWHL